jgi:hypothetical protein
MSAHICYKSDHEKERVRLYGGRAVPPVWSSHPPHCRPLQFLAPQQPPREHLQLTWVSRGPGMIDNLVFPCFDWISPTQSTFNTA